VSAILNRRAAYASCLGAARSRAPQRGGQICDTGMGVITSLGSGKAENWSKPCAGESGIRTISRFPIDGLQTTMAGSIDFLPTSSSSDHSERLADITVEEPIAQSAIGAKRDFPGCGYRKPHPSWWRDRIA